MFVLLFAIWLIVFVSGVILLQGLRNIPANPKKAGVRTRRGKPTGAVDGSGWHFYFGYPFLSGFIPVDARKIEKTIALKVNTPDAVPLTMEVNIAYRFDEKNPEMFLASGGSDEIFKSLSNTIEERVREWSISKTEGPQNWQEARAAADEAEAVILKALLGDDLPSVPGNIPTPPLLRYFAKKLPYNNLWGPKWEKLEAELAKLSPAEQTHLESAIATRRNALRAVRDGKGDLPKRSLGVVICRLGLGDIKIPAEIEAAAKKKPAAELEREAATIKNQIDAERMTHVDAQVEKFKNRLDDPKVAADFYHTETGKIKREIKETRLSVDADTIKNAGAVLTPILTPILEKFFGNNSPEPKKE